MINPMFNNDNSERTAIITEKGDVVSYAALENDIKTVAKALKDRDLIFIICRNDYVAVVFYLAALNVGAVPLIINANSAHKHIEDLTHAYLPNLVLSCESLPSGMEGFSQVSNHDGYVFYRNDHRSKINLHKDLAFLAATSGSTGDPKLVRMTAENLKSNAAAIVQYLDISAEDRAITSLPIHYSYGLSVINSHLMAGASIVLSNHSIMEKEFWQQIGEHNVTSFAGVPFHFEMMLRLGLKRMKLQGIKKITQAGGKLGPEHVKAVSEYCAEKNIRFWVMYGQTEASPRISYVPPHEAVQRPGSIGIAIPGGKMWISDENGNAVINAHQIGELVYEGPNVCMGHAEKAEDLALGDQLGGVIKTGDLAHFDEDGFYFIDGRLSRFLKIYGNRIALDQVEGLIHSMGYEGVVGGQDDHLIAYIVNLGGEENANALYEELATTMKINPQAITIKTIDEIPRLDNGKVDYQCLR